MSEPAPNETILDQAEAALLQLQWAMRLTVDHAAFIPAITLASAAEEVLGKLSGSPILKEIASELSANHGLPERQIVNDYMNDVRNWLKHGGARPEGRQAADLLQEAAMAIHRALLNCARAGLRPPPDAERYRLWAETHVAPILDAKAGD